MPFTSFMFSRLLTEVIPLVKTGLTLTFFIVALAEIVIQYEVFTILFSLFLLCLEVNKILMTYGYPLEPTSLGLCFLYRKRQLQTERINLFTLLISSILLLILLSFALFSKIHILASFLRTSFEPCRKSRI